MRKLKIEYSAMLFKVSIHHFIGSGCLIFVIQCTIFGCFIGVFMVISLVIFLDF